MMARPRFNNLDRETRHTILETAAEEFAARGFDGTSLNRLIDRLGVSKGSFYYYFDDKADLFSTVLDHAWGKVLPADALDVTALGVEDFWPQLEALMREARVKIRENPWLIGIARLMYYPPDIPEVRSSLAEKFATARQWQAELIRRGQQLGVVRNDLPVELLQALLTGADESGDRWLAANWDRFDDSEIERFASEVFDIFRRMLEPPPASVSTG